MKQLQESLLDDEEDLMKASDDSAENYRLKKWLAEHDSNHSWMNLSDYEKKLFSIKNKAMYTAASSFWLDVEDEIPIYVNIINNNVTKRAKLYLNMNSKSLNIKGSFKDFGEIYIECEESGGNISFKVPVTLNYLQINAPQLTSFDFSKISVKHLILENCDSLDLSKCKFPKGDFEYNLSPTVKKKILNEAYKKYGLNPDNEE